MFYPDMYLCYFFVTNGIEDVKCIQLLPFYQALIQDIWYNDTPLAILVYHCMPHSSYVSLQDMYVQ